MGRTSERREQQRAASAAGGAAFAAALPQVAGAADALLGLVGPAAGEPDQEALETMTSNDPERVAYVSTRPTGAAGVTPEVRACVALRVRVVSLRQVVFCSL